MEYRRAEPCRESLPSLGMAKGKSIEQSINSIIVAIRLLGFEDFGKDLDHIEYFVRFASCEFYIDMVLLMAVLVAVLVAAVCLEVIPR